VGSTTLSKRQVYSKINISVIKVRSGQPKALLLRMNNTKKHRSRVVLLKLRQPTSSQAIAGKTAHTFRSVTLKLKKSTSMKHRQLRLPSSAGVQHLQLNIKKWKLRTVSAYI
jgi:hypothetical protein